MSDSNTPPADPAPNGTVAQVQPVPPILGILVSSERLPVCSWDTTTPAGRELLQKCEEEPDTPVREMANMEFRLKDVYARVVDFTPEGSAEVVPLLRIGLVTTEGKVHMCAADGIRESLVRLMAGHKLPPWKDGIPVVVKLKATKNQRNRLTLLEVFPKLKGGK